MKTGGRNKVKTFFLIEENVSCICIEDKVLMWRENLTLEQIAKKCPCRQGDGVE